MTLTGQVTGQSANGTGHGPDSAPWLTVAEVMARTGLGERSVRRMIARERVVSRVDGAGRRVILESSLPGQSQDSGQGTSHGFGHDSEQGAGHDSGQGTDHDSRRDRSQDTDHDRAMIAFLQGQLQQSRDAEKELRLLLAQAVKTNQLLATPPALPPGPEVSAIADKRRVRWWAPWRR